MKTTYYKIVSKYSNKYELLISEYQNGLIERGYGWAVEGTKFSATRLEDVKKLAEQYDAEIYEVCEHWTRIR